ncbi:hypothetical protein BOG92_000770 [Streptomyces sp. WAC00263]|nr:hypothetical protein BOG92_000770 [Streptomyces sp. WAC00263]
MGSRASSAIRASGGVAMTDRTASPIPRSSCWLGPVHRAASHPELRELCGQIISTQATEITQLKAWLHTWYDKGTRHRAKSR